MRLPALALAIPLLLAGCLPAHVPLLPGAETRPLEIVAVEAPASARAGEPVTLTLRARVYGPGWRVAGARAELDGAARTVLLGGLAAPTEAAPPATTPDGGVREEALTVTFTPVAAGSYRLLVPHGVERARLERTIRVLD